VNILVVIRFFLGIVESSVMPAMLIFLSRWFTKAERSRANTFLILGNPVTILWMSILSGYLLNAFGWRWMFILEGIPAVLWALIWWKVANDHPDDSKWLSHDDKVLLKEQLLKEQTAIKPVKNYGMMLRSPGVIMLSFQYALWSIGVYGFVMWLPSIIKAVPNMDIVSTGWYAALPYLFAIIGMIVASWLSDKTGNRRVFVWPLLLIGAIAFYGSYLVGENNFYLSYTLLIIAGAMMYAPYGPFFAIIPEVLPANVAGVAMAVINSFGALGSFIGAYVVGLLNAKYGDFSMSYLFMAGSLAVSSLLTIMATSKRKI
jgi:sugar phosphate permease